MRKTLLIIGVLLLWSGLVVAQDGEGIGTIQLSQWASSAEASSEYGSTSWSAERATGEPDVLECADSGNSWASAGITDGETLTLYYDEPVIPTQVNIYQNLAPGGIQYIEVISVDGEALRIRNSEDPGGDCPTVFSVNLPSGLPMSNGVRLHIDQVALDNWNEIDAVELVGTTEGEAADTEPTSLDMSDFPQYTLVTNEPTEGPTSSRDEEPDPEPTPILREPEPEIQVDTTVDYGGEWGTSVTCPDGTIINNGVEITIVQQRPGSTYLLTAVGLNGFDPVMAVMDDFGTVICNDDAGDAASYGARLPTTGNVAPNRSSSQIQYRVTGNTFANIKIIVGGYQGTGGEFLLTVEGMISTSADNAGDPFSVYISPALIESDVDPTAYMISVVRNFDPFIYLVDADLQPLQIDKNTYYSCDDAGRSCWGESTSLNGTYVSRSQNRQLPGGTFDAMMTVPVDSTMWGSYINYTMTGDGTYGDYLALFHLGTTAER